MWKNHGGNLAGWLVYASEMVWNFSKNTGLKSEQLSLGLKVISAK